LGAAVTRAGGAPLHEQIDGSIAVPLGMSSLQPDYQWVEIPGRARGYQRVAGVVLPSVDRDVSWKLAGGGFISTVGDLARFARGLMGEALLPQEALDLMWTRQRLASGERTSYGLGFGLASAGGERVIRHTGSQPKTRTLLSLRPDSQRAVVVMTNSEFGRVKPVAAAAWAVLDQRR
ncbi:MAG: serine hydrolase domain-containing protein, partial [Planctomycetota bacterium]